MLCPHKSSSGVGGGPHVPPAGREGQDGRAVFPALCLCRPYKTCWQMRWERVSHGIFLPGFGQPHLSGTRGHLRGDRSCSDSPSSHPHVPHPAPAKEKLRQSGTDPSPLALELHRGFGRLDVPMEPPGPGDTCDPWRWLLSQPRLQRGTQRWDSDTKSWREGSGCSRPTQSPWS